MPPIKTYNFVQIYQEDIVEVIIKAYSFEEAMYSLIEIVKHPADYKCINI